MKNLRKNWLTKNIKPKRVITFSVCASLTAAAVTATAATIINENDVTKPQFNANFSRQNDVTKAVSVATNDQLVPNYQGNLADSETSNDSPDSFSAMQSDQFINSLIEIQNLINDLKGLELQVTSTVLVEIRNPRFTDWAHARQRFASYLGLTGVNSTFFFNRIDQVISSINAAITAGPSLISGLGFLFTRQGLTADGIANATITPVYKFSTAEAINLDPKRIATLNIKVTGINEANRLAQSNAANQGNNNIKSEVDDEYKRIKDLHWSGTVTSPISEPVVNVAVANLDAYGISNTAFNTNKFVYKISHASILESGSYTLSLKIFSLTNQNISSEEIAITIIATIAKKVVNNDGGVGTSDSSDKPNAGLIISGATLGALAVVTLPFAIFFAAKRWSSRLKLARVTQRPSWLTNVEEELAKSPKVNAEVNAEEMVEIADNFPDHPGSVPPQKFTRFRADDATSSLEKTVLKKQEMIRGSRWWSRWSEIEGSPVERPTSPANSLVDESIELKAMNNKPIIAGEGGLFIPERPLTSEEELLLYEKLQVQLPPRKSFIKISGVTSGESVVDGLGSPSLLGPEATPGASSLDLAKIAQSGQNFHARLIARAQAGGIEPDTFFESISRLPELTVGTDAMGGISSVEGFAELSPALKAGVESFLAHIPTSFTGGAQEAAAILRQMSGTMGDLTAQIIAETEGLSIGSAEVISALTGRAMNFAEVAGLEMTEGLAMLEAGFESTFEDGLSGLLEHLFLP